MKLGILGGSFNPVHLGHFFLADKAISALNLDRVIMIPAYLSPFKLEASGMKSSTGDRLEMLAAAAAGDSRIAIDDCEIRREGVSYTIDTLKDIITRYMPTGKPYLIIGDDLAGDFPKWRDSKKILELADIAIARRLNDAAVQYPFPHTVIGNEVMNISSQTVRQKIGEGNGWKSLVPPAVSAIIEDRQLYCLGSGGKGSTHEKHISKELILRIEAAARENLSIEKFLHSRSTALLAQDLCRRFGLDPMTGYLAGIAHDLCKQFDVKHLIKLAKDDGREISPLEKDKPNLLHGRAAAVLLKERFSIHNKDILQAVAFHTSGSEYMGALAKVIYIADKVEYSRNIDPAFRQMCLEETALKPEAALDRILFAVLKKTVSKLQSKELDLSGETLRLLERMKEKTH